MMLDPTDLMFFNRPRRFGKSMILQGLEYFINTRVKETQVTKERSLAILSQTLFNEGSKKNAAWSAFKTQMDSMNYVAIKLDFSNLKRYASVGQFSEGLVGHFQGEVKQCLSAHPHLNRDIKDVLKVALQAQTPELLLDSLTKGSGITS